MSKADSHEQCSRTAFQTVYRPDAPDAQAIVALPLVFVVLAVGYRAMDGVLDEGEKEKRSYAMHFAGQSFDARRFML